MVEHLTRWRQHLNQTVQQDDESYKVTWDPVMGFRLMTTKHEIIMTAMSLDGTTRMMLGMIWA
jgi:hypothetical protein